MVYESTTVKNFHKRNKLNITIYNICINVKMYSVHPVVARIKPTVNYLFLRCRTNNNVLLMDIRTE